MQAPIRYTAADRIHFRFFLSVLPVPPTRNASPMPKPGLGTGEANEWSICGHKHPLARPGSKAIFRTIGDTGYAIAMLPQKKSPASAGLFMSIGEGEPEIRLSLHASATMLTVRRLFGPLTENSTLPSTSANSV